MARLTLLTKSINLLNFNTMKAFATNLRKVRDELGWKSARIAATHIGILAKTYSSYEEGRAEPDSEGLCKIAEGMGITNLFGFLSNPNFDYHNQDFAGKVRHVSPLHTNYFSADERDRKIVDLILGIGVE